MIKIFLFIFFSSCTFYPHYQRPCMEMPESWRIATDETKTICNIRWWEQLNDPVLNALIEEALESNNDLRSATARIAQFKAQVGIVSSQLYPQIYAQGITSRTRLSQALAGEQILTNPKDSYGGEKGGKNGVIPDLSQLFPVFDNDYRGVITASYELDLWGKIRSARDASIAELIGQVDARRAIILTVVSSVASAYILLRQYDWQLQISFQTVRSRQESYKLAKVRFEEGLTSELEVAQSLADLDQAEIQVIKYQTLIPLQENLISVLIGHPPQAIQRGLSVDHWGLPPQIPAGLPADLLEQRPDIMQAEELLMAANFRIGEARALYFPDITLTGFYGSESAELHSLLRKHGNGWPIFYNPYLQAGGLQVLSILQNLVNKKRCITICKLFL